MKFPEMFNTPLLHQIDMGLQILGFRSDDEGSMYLENVGNIADNHMVKTPITQLTTVIRLYTFSL
jgi:hypothetical protein